jgi:hypothetical protein
MSQLDEYLTKYITQRSIVLEKYVIEAFDSEDKRVLCMESFQGTILLNDDLKNCEFLRDAEIFSEEIKLHRNGHNCYRVFRLTQKGLRFAEDLKRQSPNKKKFAADITVS